MTARYRDRYDEWDDEFDDEWGDDQYVVSSPAYEEYKRNYLNWSLYEDADGIWRCTCRKYQIRKRCFHMRYARKEQVIKVKEEYL